MKKVLVLLLLVSLRGNAQSQKFIETWNYVKQCSALVDSMCDAVTKQTTQLRNNKSKVRIRNSKKPWINHTIVTRIDSGKQVVSQLYKYGKDKQIKIIEIEGKIMSINFMWNNVTANSFLKSHFTRLGNDKWFWTYSGGQYANEETKGDLYPDKLVNVRLVETVTNWPKLNLFQ
jgi:hypothetical protein